MNKYKVTEELMNELNKWKKTIKDNDLHVDEISLDDFPGLVDDWVFTENSVFETINRLITLMHFVNGEDVFEIGTPKYILQRKGANLKRLREYIRINEYDGIEIDYFKENATRFDDFAKASAWANKHFEVVEVDE